MTGSTVQLGAEQLEQVTTVSVDQALQGRVAGLNVSTGSGTPGSTTNIRIRGHSSITAGNEPLYVIDGVPVTNSNVSGTSSGSSLTALASINNSDIDFTVLQEFQKNRNYYLYAEGIEFGTDGLTNLSTAGTPSGASSTFTDWAVASYMGTIGYSFDSRYVLNATFRREGNSRFSAENRWGNFYSVGAAWNLHQEPFFEDNDDVNTLKLRASYGVTGNANINLNSYQGLFGYSTNYVGTAAAFPSTYGNDELSWETSHTLDLGFDFAFFNHALDGSVAYYNRESKYLLLNVPLSRTTGFASQTRNIGRMKNSGVEVGINYDIIRSDDFNLPLKATMLPMRMSGIVLRCSGLLDDFSFILFGWRLSKWQPSFFSSMK